MVLSEDAECQQKHSTNDRNIHHHQCCAHIYKYKDLLQKIFNNEKNKVKKELLDVKVFNINGSTQK